MIFVKTKYSQFFVKRMIVLFTAFSCCMFCFSQRNSDSEGLRSDTVKSKINKLFSIHTNLVDWALTVPNVSVEIDFDRRKRSHYSFLVSGKYNWNTNHTFNPKFVLNVASAKGEFRKYWRTGNQENASVPAVDDINSDTTLNYISRTSSYLRRRYLSGVYEKNARSWRAYYFGVYTSFNRFSFSFSGEGVQGTGASIGLSYGWTLPLTKRIDGSGFDLDLGLSAGAIATQYDKYTYNEESSCYIYNGHQKWKVIPYPMIQDVHVSLVYRFRSIDKKVLYGAERFAYHEAKRLDRENVRLRKMTDKQNARDSLTLLKPLDIAIAKAEAQLDAYKDSTAYSFYVLKNAIEQAKSERGNLYGNVMLRNVLIKELEYYQKIAELRRKEEEK